MLSDEYEQIFHGIPTLFEYLLEILEKRPEILEKDDVSFFQEPLQEACERDNTRKREICEQCESNLASAENHFEGLKKNIVMNYVSNVKDANTDGDYSIGEVVTEIPEIKTAKRNHDNKKAPNFSHSKSKTKTNKMERKDKAKGKKRNVNTDESFLGSIDWSKLNLSPEEVEEQTLKIEQAIEEHNKKKER